MVNKDMFKNLTGKFLLLIWGWVKNLLLGSYKKLIRVSLWQKVLYILAISFIVLLIISICYLIIKGTLASLLLCIAFGALLFIDVLLIVLFYYDLKSKKGLSSFIQEFDEVKEKYSRLTEKNEMDIPWFLMIGKSDAGKTGLLKKGGIHFFNPKYRATSEISTFFNKSLLVWKYNIDNAEKVAEEDTSEDNAQNGNKDFDAFLQFLKTRKNLLNLNGIILAITADEFINNDKEYLIKKGKEYSEFINNVQHILGISLPLYLTITKSDKICGFNEFIRNLDSKYYKQIFGWTNKLSRAGEKFSSEEFLGQIESIINKANEQKYSFLQKYISESSKTQYYDTSSYFAFPENLKLISSNIAIFTESLAIGVYANSRLYEKKFNIVPLFVRGIYFTSTEQDINFYDKVYFSEASEVKEFKRKEHLSLQESALFVKEFIQEILCKGSDISMRLTSLRRSYKWKRIAGIVLIFSSFFFLIIFTSMYWVNVFRYISFDKNNLNTTQKQGVRSSLLYLAKDVKIVNARDNYLTLMGDISGMVSEIKEENKNLVNTTVSGLSVPYTSLDNFNIDQRFNPDYLTKVTEQWEEISAIAAKKPEVINADQLKDAFVNGEEEYLAYLDQYYMYWVQILDNSSTPLLVPWETLKKQRYQYWQIANNYRVTADIISNAFQVYKDKTKNYLSVDKAAALDSIILSLKEMKANIADAFIQNKAIDMTSFWDRVFTASDPLEGRDLIYKTNNETLYKDVVFKYTQRTAHQDYYQLYWQRVSLMYFRSLDKALLDKANNYLTQLNAIKSFPLYTQWDTNGGLSIDKLKTILDTIDSYWPTEDIYPDNTVGHGQIDLDPTFSEVILDLKPRLDPELMKKVYNLKSLIANMLPPGGGKEQFVKVYLMPSTDDSNDNNGADYWTVMKMTQDKSPDNTTSIRTRSDSETYLGKLDYPSVGKISFDFFLTPDSLKGYNPAQSLSLSGEWSPLKLIFNGPERPQAYKGEYYVTWKAVRQLDDNTWISKISFVKSDNQNISFYLKLIFSSDISSITRG